MPALPRPATRTREPVNAPGGMRTSSVSIFCTRPSPPHRCCWLLHQDALRAGCSPPWRAAVREPRQVPSWLFHLRVRGLHKLAKAGAFLICSNHQSYLDPPILASVLPGEIFDKVFAVGTSEIFGKGFMRRLARSLRIVVVDPDANLVPAMRAGAFGLRQGRALILYPEGERSIDGTPKTFKKGAAILSIHLQVPIVPVAIEGFYEAWPRNKPFQRFSPLRIEFGDPIIPVSPTP